MPVRTIINSAYVRDVVWQLRMSLNELNKAAGLSHGYIYELAPDGGESAVDASMSTIDKLHNAIEALMIERNINPPDRLWEKLVIHEEIERLRDA